MYSKEVVLQNQVGLHARPATFFIQKANEFKSSIWVEKDERRVNAKSLLGVLSLDCTRYGHYHYRGRRGREGSSGCADCFDRVEFLRIIPCTQDTAYKRYLFLWITVRATFIQI